MRSLSLIPFALVMAGALALPGTSLAQKHLTQKGVDPHARASPNSRKLPPPKPVEVPTAYEPDKIRLAQLDSAMWPQVEEAKRTLKEVHFLTWAFPHR